MGRLISGGCLNACKLGPNHSKHLLPSVKVWSPSWKGGSDIAVNKPKPKRTPQNPHQNTVSIFFIISDISVERNKKNANKHNHMRQAGSFSISRQIYERQKVALCVVNNEVTIAVSSCESNVLWAFVRQKDQNSASVGPARPQRDSKQATPNSNILISSSLAFSYQT